MTDTHKTALTDDEIAYLYGGDVKAIVPASALRLARNVERAVNERHASILPAASEAHPVLYQHSDGRYGLSLTGQPGTFTAGDPEWYRVPLDVVEPAASEAGAVPNVYEIQQRKPVRNALLEYCACPTDEIACKVVRAVLDAAPPARPQEAGAVALPAWWGAFIQNVCEIPERNSPEDDPEAIVATRQELENCALSAIEDDATSAAQPENQHVPDMLAELGLNQHAQPEKQAGHDGYADMWRKLRQAQMKLSDAVDAAALLAAPPAPSQQAAPATESVYPQPCADLRYHDEFRRGWNACLTEATGSDPAAESAEPEHVCAKCKAALLAPLGNRYVCGNCGCAESMPTAATADAQGDERAAFETWAAGKKMPLARIGQQYDDFWVDHAWTGWQARAALAAAKKGDAQ